MYAYIIGLKHPRESVVVVLCFGGANVLPHQEIRPRAYVQVVENNRVDGAVRQSVIANLGRADDLIASGRSRLAVGFRGQAH